ncbi:MAG: WYL domain-containing protein, partial [Ignavibacteria bacterium]
IKDCKVDDLADKYQVAVVTINRDLSDLRSMGIPINSVYNKGIEINGKVEHNIIADLIVKYIALYHSDVIIQDTLFNASIESNIDHIFIFSSLNVAIDNKSRIVLKYKYSDVSLREILLLPCKIIQNSCNLTFIGIHDNKVEIYEFKKIIAMRMTDETDETNYELKISNFLRNSVIPAPSKIKLKLHIENHTNLEKFKISSLKVSETNYANVFKGEITQNSLDDLAIWVIQQSGNVKVLEPKSVRDRIVELAQLTLALHNQESVENEVKKNDILIEKVVKTNDKTIKPKYQKVDTEKFKVSVNKNDIKSDDSTTKELPFDKINKSSENNYNIKYQDLSSSNGMYTKKFQDESVISMDHSIFEPPLNNYNEFIIQADKSDLYSFPYFKKITSDNLNLETIDIELSIDLLNIYREKKSSIIKRIIKWIK